MKEISDGREEIGGGSYSRMGREQIKREEGKRKSMGEWRWRDTELLKEKMKEI